MNTYGQGFPSLSELSATIQLYTLFKNATGKGKVERSFCELLAARLFRCWRGKRFPRAEGSRGWKTKIEGVRCDGKTSVKITVGAIGASKKASKEAGSWTTTVQEHS